jgi:hypothetical protein
MSAAEPLDAPDDSSPIQQAPKINGLRVLALLVPTLGFFGLFVFLIHSLSEMRRSEPTFNLFGAKQKATVSGRVTLNGKPLPFGKIHFQSADGKFLNTTEIIDGKYQLKGVRADRGTKVMVLTSFASSEVALLAPEVGRRRQITRLAGQGRQPPERPQELQEKLEALQEEIEQLEERLVLLKKVVPVPARYEKEETTPFTFTPEKGSQTFDLRLEDP